MINIKENFMGGYRLTIRLVDSTKPIYRVLKLPGKLTFCDLHSIIQEILGLKVFLNICLI